MCKEEFSSRSLQDLIEKSAEFNCTKEEFFQALDIIYQKAEKEGLKISGPIVSVENGLNKLTYVIQKNSAKIGEIRFYYGSHYLKYKHYVKFSKL